MKTSFLLFAFLLFFSEGLTSQNVLLNKIKHSKEFRDAAEKLALEPGSIHTVNTSFIIDNTGILEAVSAESEYPELEIVAINILNSLTLEEAPKHISTKKNKIILPMTFYVETEERKRHRLRKELRQKKN